MTDASGPFPGGSTLPIQRKKSELPLIAFTLCTPAAVGVAAAALPAGAPWTLGATALALTVIGMLASIVHLAKPLRAPYSIRHWDGSWLSREILVVSAFALLLVLWVAAGLLLPDMPAAAIALDAGSLIVGWLLLTVIAKAYRVHGQPAWDGRDTLLEVRSIACGLGGAVALVAFTLLQQVDVRAATDIDGVFAMALLFTGPSLYRQSWQMRLQRLQHVAETDFRPRVMQALADLKAVEADHHRTDRQLSASVICGALALLLGATTLLFATPEAAAALPGSPMLIVLMRAQLAAAAACAGFQLVACYHIRHRFYDLASTSRYAAVLHPW